jgi:glycosyltransferase involved in cell wall biosynthesis
MYGWEFPPHISGGLGIACYGIVNELAKKGAKITFVLPQAIENMAQGDNISIVGCDLLSTSIDTSFFESLVDIKKIDAMLHPYMTNDSYLQSLMNANTSSCSTDELKSYRLTGRYGPNLLTEVFRYALAAGVLAKSVPHDVIHAHDWLTILAGIEAKKFSNKPLIFHVHALEPDRSGTNINEKVFAIERYGMQQADKIVAVSQYTKNIIMQHYGIPHEKIVVVHNGIYSSSDLQGVDQSKPFKMVLFLGRLTHQKGPYFFIEVAKKILERRDDVHFVIAGSGDMMEDMIYQVARSHIGKNVHFTGFLDQGTVARLYKLADVYVMPSVSEPFGLTCLEALVREVPVVISKQSGVTEVLHNALKADFWDVNDLAAKTLALLDYRALRKELLANAAEEIREITWEKTASKLIDLYHESIFTKRL